MAGLAPPVRARARGAGASARAQARKLTVARQLATTRDAQLEAQANHAAHKVTTGGRGAARGLDPAPAASATVARSAGRPLGPAVQAMLERGFGADLREVRIHRDPEASAAAHALRAHAFTAGRDIYLADASPELDTPAGRELLAHEAAHVLQQTSAGPRAHPAATDRTGAGSVQMAAVTLPAVTPAPDALVPQIKPAPGPIPAKPAPQASPPVPELHAKPAPAKPAAAAVKPMPPAHDPARAVELARRSPCVELPHRAEVERRLKISTSALQVHIGPEATAACRLLDAAAFTVHNVIVFAEANPPLSRVLHEVAHVIQQGAVAGAAPDRYTPGTLAIAPAGSQPEREAAGAARGTPKTYLTSAKPAVYRDKKAGNDEPARADGTVPDPEPAAELLLRRMIVKYPFKDKYKDKPRFGVQKSSSKEFTHLYKESSEPWTTQDFVAVTKKREQSERPGYTDDDWLRRAQDLVRQIFDDSSGQSLAATKFVYNGQTYRTAQVETYIEKKKYFRKYIFIGATTTTDNPQYRDLLQDSDSPQPTEKTDAEKLADYQVIVKRLKAVADGKDPTSDKKLAFADETMGTGKASDWSPLKKKTPLDVDKLLETIKAQSEDEAGTKAARDAITDFIAKRYHDIKELHNNVVHAPVFVHPYDGLKGAIFAAWASTRFSGGKFDPDVQPIFADYDEESKEFSENPILKKFRFGDAALPPPKATGKTWHLVEAKARSVPPDDEAVSQARAYLLIITKPIQGWYRIKTSDGSPDYEARTFSHVHYLFSSVDVAKLWISEAYKDDKKLAKGVLASIFTRQQYTPTPDPDPKKAKFTLGVKKNPVFKFEITDADKLEHDFKDEDVKQKPPGVTIKSAHLVLANQRDPHLASGSIELALQMGKPKKTEDEAPFASKDAKPEAVTPTEVDLAATAGPAGAQAEAIAGTLSNKPTPMKSGLDKILKRIRTDAKLTDKGLTASVTIVEGDDKDGIFKGFDLKAGSGLTVTLGPPPAFKPVLSGTIGIIHKSGKFDADLKVDYDGEFWSFSANANVKELITGLKPFQAKVAYSTKDGNLSIEATNLSYSRAFKTVTVTGSIAKISYETATDTFAGEGIKLAADIGGFAEASVEASFKNSELTEATLKLNQDKPFKYPKVNSILTGKAGGEVHWKKGEKGDDVWDGHLEGDVTLTHKLFKKVAPQGIGVHLDVKVKDTGSIDGSVTTTTPLVLGKHFSIPSITLAVTEGKVSGEITATIVKVKNLENASATIAFADGKVTLKSLDVKAKLGDPDKDRFWGEIGLDYNDEKGLGFHGTGHFRIKNYVVNGTVDYWTGTDSVSVHLWTDPITLLKYGPKEWQLYKLAKQIKLVSFYQVIGIYLDVGFDLKFSLDFGLTFTPDIIIANFNLHTHDFDNASAHLKIEGTLTATLSTTPYVGLGVFVLDPAIVRGGGGIMVPISAVATAKASADLGATLDKQGNVVGSAKVGVGLWFEIYGDVKPYAEFVVLDGQFTKRWEGESLKHFTILPKRELFTFQHDFNTATPDAKKDPALPEENKPRSAPELKADKVISQSEGSATDTKATIDKDKGTKTGTPDETEAQDEGGFDIKKLLGDGEGLKSLPLYKSIASVIDAAGKIWKDIKDAFWKVVNFFKNWFDAAVHGIEVAIEFLKKIVEEKSVFGALKFYLSKVMPKGLYDVIEPLLSALGGFEKAIYNAIESSLPTDVTGWLTWGFKMMKAMLGAAWDNAPALIDGLTTMFYRAKTQTRAFVNYLISERKLGVKKDTIKTYVRVHVAGIDFYDEGYTTGVVAAPMWAALKLIGATPTDGDDNFWN